MSTDHSGVLLLQGNRLGEGMFNLISGFTMSECSDLITCAYNSAAWYRYLAKDSENNRDYWLERAEKSELLGDKLNDAYSKALYIS